jgi:hypothetical protein
MRFNLKDPLCSLCHSCDESQILKNDRGKETIVCHYGGRVIRVVSNVVECSTYSRIGQMSKFEAEKVGWVLEKRGNKVGFRPPESE